MRSRRRAPRTGTLAAIFRSRLRRLRKASGLTPEEVAQRAGVDPDVVQRLERERGSNPTLDVVERIAAALGRDPLDLLPCGEGSVVGEEARTLREEVVRAVDLLNEIRTRIVATDVSVSTIASRRT